MLSLELIFSCEKLVIENSYAKVFYIKIHLHMTHNAIMIISMYQCDAPESGQIKCFRTGRSSLNPHGDIHVCRGVYLASKNRNILALVPFVIRKSQRKCEWNYLWWWRVPCLPLSCCVACSMAIDLHMSYGMSYYGHCLTQFQGKALSACQICITVIMY